MGGPLLSLKGIENSLRPILRPTEYTQKFHKNWSSLFGGVWLQTLTRELYTYIRLDID